MTRRRNPQAVTHVRRLSAALAFAILFLLVLVARAPAELQFDDQYPSVSGNLIATDPGGNLYVADQANYQVEKFSPSGDFISTWGWGVQDGANQFEVCTDSCQAGISGSGAGQFGSLGAVSTDSAGDVYVADTGNNRVQKFSPTGDFISTWGWGVQDGANQLQVCTSGCQAGTAGSGDGQISPLGVAVDSRGGSPSDAVYVTDSGNSRIEKFSSTGDFISAWGWGVADGADQYEVCTSSCQAGIRGDIGGFTGNRGGGGQFTSPTGLATDSSGNLYVNDTQNWRIEKFSSAGAFQVVWGWGVQDGSQQFETCTASCQGGLRGDGAGKFDFAAGVAVDSSGTVFVGNTGNKRVETFSSSGAFLRAWGYGVADGADQWESCTTTCLRGGGSGNSPHFNAAGVATDGADHLYAADASTQVFKFNQVAATDSASQDVPAGQTSSTNYETSPQDPVGTAVTTPTGGQVTIDEGATTTADPAGYSLLGQEVMITAPAESADQPLTLQFRLDASVLGGADETQVQVFRDGVVIADCDADAGTSATPDPCVSNRASTDQGIALTVRTSAASTWNFGVASGDNTPPETTITSGPSGATNDSTPTFAFSSEPGASFECQVDNAAFASCTSPKTLPTQSDGPHTFRVRATDAAGNTDQSPAVRTFRVDTHAPNTFITSGPSGPTNDSTPTFSFTSFESGSSFQCRVDSGPVSGCSSPKTLSALSDGSHTLRVRATDAAGNTDTSPAERTFRVDTHAPDTTISSGPSGNTRDRTPTFAFRSSEPSGASFECRLDGAAFKACSSPKTYSTLSFGTHTFRVRAIDAAGNVDSSPAARTFTVIH